MPTWKDEGRERPAFRPATGGEQVIRQDYLMRMIQQLSGVLARVAGLRADGRPDEALEEIGEAYGRFAGLNPSLVHALSEEDLVALLRARGGLDPQRTYALAELLREEAEIFAEAGRPEEAIPRDRKALRLYLEVLPELEDAPSPPDLAGLDAVLARVDPTAIPTAGRELLLRHYEGVGRFGEAEDLLFDLLDADDHAPETADLARAFYARLLALPDAALEAGNLPREEVEEGRARLG
ncbi:MAG: DUF6483 family protein [Chloroflexota bacterium]|nr:DUF6483 family protein [Chloroflexota bacterium]